MVKASMVQSGVWSGEDPLTHAVMFVDGPYKNARSADTSVSSLVGIDSAARGGLYVVSAGIAKHLGDAVKSVAACVGGGSTGESTGVAGGTSSTGGNGGSTTNGKGGSTGGKGGSTGGKLTF
jgi:hypothetical protein